MKKNDLWLITAGLQLAIVVASAFNRDWSGAVGGMFGCFMCLIYWHEVSGRAEH